jgi:DNA-binding MurR/RpiR family transcriptional regulator
MNGHGSKFGRKKEQAIAALLTHRNVEESAKAAGVSTATLKRWMRLPEFQGAYREARREVVLQTNARMQQNSGVAASVLFKLMADPATPPSIRARTAQCILECANRSLELEDIEVRLARLEENEQRGREDRD